MSRVEASDFAVLLVVVLAAPLAGAVAADEGAATATLTPARQAATGNTPAVLPGGTESRPAGSGADIGAAAVAGKDPPDANVAALVEADLVTFRITVFDNASARWSIVYTRRLENETERQRFEEFAATFNGEETTAYANFKRQARGLAAAGRNSTGRAMNATDFSKHASLGGNCAIPDDCGTVRMSFTWTAFAREADDRLVVDDVFEGGLYLGTDQSLVFAAGPDLSFASVKPDPDSQSDPDALSASDTVTWRGERTFADRRPLVAFEPGESGATAVSSPGGTATGETPAGGGPTGDGPTATTAGGGSSGVMPLVLAGGLVVVLTGLAFAVASRRDGGAPAATGGPDAGDGGGAAVGEPAVADEELLTDEDEVVKLLRENGGRMKQVNIVDETGWSKSKVSMLLSDMEEDGRISKLRVGRENIVSLAGHEPEAANSALDDG
ncbi:MAG: hypothetical protein V5A23_01370 [Halobacteriales archaeon]